MKQYKVLASSLTGKHGKTYTAGATISEDQIYDGHAEELEANKAIELIIEPQPGSLSADPPPGEPPLTPDPGAEEKKN